MTRLGVLRAGYGALGFAFAGIAGSVYVPSLLLPGLALAIVAGILLAFSDDPLPKWAGFALLGYFLFTIVLFLAATPITINRGGERYFANPAPPELAGDLIYWTGLGSPLMLASAGILSAWERERAARVLLAGAAVGFVVVGALSIVLVPQLEPECATDPFAAECSGAAERAASEAARQGDMLRALTALSAAAGAAGAIWAAGRADEYA